MKERIQELTEKRRRWIEANEENNFQEGIGNLLTQLYPDNAHFIYELLQNAEDAKANTLEFDLRSDKLIFKHDGKKLFLYEDIESITAIGNSTKQNDPTNIGKFGVGFKAVFAYTKTPEIYSGSIEFRISQLVLPELIRYNENSYPSLTQFTFPFNNPQKDAKTAFNEVLKGLEELTSTSLLFLENIQSIAILMDGKLFKHIEKTYIDENFIHIKLNDQNEDWLQFNKTVSLQEKQLRVSIAFCYDKSNKRVNPIDGKVNIYFPCEKETSLLKFHIHAPFASTVARDSVRNTKENETLIAAIAELAAESMLIIRNKELLNTNFLSVLPNSQDNIPAFYKIIEIKIKEKFKTDDLVPMQKGKYAAANGIFIGYNDVRTLFNDDDLATFLNTNRNHNYFAPMWVKGYANETRRDCFLNDLGIVKWGWKDFLIFVTKNDCTSFFDTKDSSWFRKLYATLSDKNLVTQQENYHWLYGESSNKILAENLSIVKLKNGRYEIGENCYFLTKNYGYTNDFLFVDEKTYSYNPEEKQEKVEAESAMKFLINLGVKKVDEEEIIKIILEKRYSENHINPQIQDILRFVRYFKQYGNNINFKDYYIFMTSAGNWVKGEDLYIDSPFYDTGLNEFHKVLGNKATRFPLSQEYFTLDKLNQKDFTSFLLACNVIDKLSIERKSCKTNPYWGSLLSKVNGQERYDTKTEIDYTIKGLPEILNNKKINVQISKLIWHTLNDNTEVILTARYSPNASSPTRTAPSILILLLKETMWVPQIVDGKTDFAKPQDASFNLLPKDKDFIIVKDKKWLEAVEFGKALEQKKIDQAKSEVEQAKEEKLVQDLGFSDREEARKVAEYFKKLKAKGKKIDDLIREEEPRPNQNNLGEIYPLERATRLEQQLNQSPMKKPEQVQRTVDTNKDKIDAREYLENFYKESNNKIRCQLCDCYMPFKLRSGKDYFEKVEAIPLNIHHECKYLALCPTCSALYKEHVKEVPEKLKHIKEELLKENNNKITLFLDKKKYELYFRIKHRGDIRTAIKSEITQKIKSGSKLKL